MGEVGSNVKVLPGCKVHSDEPCQGLIDVLRDALAMAESGQLRSLVGTGFTSGGEMMALWADTESDIYRMRGAIAWLETEYVERHIVAQDE